jgi:hypothetical protein
MSAAQFPALSAIAFQLAAAVERYDEEVAVMLHAPRDADAYQRVSRRMDEMRMYAAALPPVAVAWVELMIRHFELTHGLWRAQQDPASQVELAGYQRRLREAVSSLSRKCAHLMPSA